MVHQKVVPREVEQRSNLYETAMEQLLQMSDLPNFLNANHSGHDSYKTCQVEERILNAAIIEADIGRSFEEYLEIFNRFYADDIEVSSDTGKESIRGKERVRSILLDFLVPLHVFAEIGGVSISIRETAIVGDALDETHSAWTLDLVGASGKICTLSWRTFRKWEALQVVREHHYEHQQTGGPLTFDDMRFSAADPNAAFQTPFGRKAD
jgi:hypothetical protein